MLDQCQVLWSWEVGAAGPWCLICESMLGRIVVLLGASRSAEVSKKEFPELEAAIKFAEEFTGCSVELSATFVPFKTLDVLSRLRLG